MLDIPRRLLNLNLILLDIQYLIYVPGRHPLPKYIPHPTKHALQAMDTLRHQTIDTVLVIDEQLLEALDLEAVEVVVDRDEVEGEVAQGERAEQVPGLQVLFAHC
jgi:hypothetical protein